MSAVRLNIRFGETDIEITESNTDRLDGSIFYGAPVDFDRLEEPLASLIANTVVRACAAAGVPLGDVLQRVEGVSDVIKQQ